MKSESMMVKRSGYVQASAEYEKKLLKQADLFLE